MDLEIKIPTEFFTVFNKVTYFDEPHKYYINGRELISVTTLIHKYAPEFDEAFWSEKKGKEYNRNPKEILMLWKFINEKGTMKGSIIHDYAESLFLNKVFEYPKEKIINHFGFDPVLKEYEITKKHVDRFYKDTFNKLIPIKTELVVCDEESGIGGMVDMLFYNVKAGEFQIWDWKTNKKFTNKSKEGYKLKGALSNLDDCDLEIYSLQLELYKYIIEKYIPIKLGRSYLTWFSHNNDNYKVIRTEDRSKEVKKMLFKHSIM